MRLIPCLELEAALAGSVSQRLHAAMEPEPGAIERDGLDAEGLRLLGDALAHDRSRRLVAAVLEVLAHVGLEGRRTGQHLVAGRRDDLRVDVAVRAAHREADGTLLGDTHPGFAGAPDS